MNSFLRLLVPRRVKAHSAEVSPSPEGQRSDSRKVIPGSSWLAPDASVTLMSEASRGATFNNLLNLAIKSCLDGRNEHWGLLAFTWSNNQSEIELVWEIMRVGEPNPEDT